MATSLKLIISADFGFVTIVTHVISKLTTEDENGFFTGEIEWI
ncbi:hypothetical protein [Caldifermentibacillus hisashii]|nr:hypothetical protein [Caldifermentibacillus hisashii]MEC5273721.1 hypothetical protein [Caldifermentibacillus hisashii]